MGTAHGTRDVLQDWVMALPSTAAQRYWDEIGGGGDMGNTAGRGRGQGERRGEDAPRRGRLPTGRRSRPTPKTVEAMPEHVKEHMRLVARFFRRLKDDSGMASNQEIADAAQRDYPGLSKAFVSKLTVPASLTERGGIDYLRMRAVLRTLGSNLTEMDAFIHGRGSGMATPAAVRRYLVETHTPLADALAEAWRLYAQAHSIVLGEQSGGTTATQQPGDTVRSDEDAQEAALLSAFRRLSPMAREWLIEDARRRYLPRDPAQALAGWNRAGDETLDDAHAEQRTEPASESESESE